jgi:sulfonate transport system substrate-binding protein
LNRALGGSGFCRRCRAANSAAHGKEIRIGLQKDGTRVRLKPRGTLDGKLAPLGFKSAWAQFPSGPPLLEASQVGAIDCGTTGEPTHPSIRQPVSEPSADAGRALGVFGGEPAERGL